MGQFFGIEEIRLVSKTSQTTIEWESGSILRIGGQGYTIDSTLVLDLATDIDTGSVTADTKYYIYAVVSTGIVSLKYSLSNSSPTISDPHRRIGVFQTDDVAEIVEASNNENSLETYIAPAPDKLSTATGNAPSYSIRAWATFDGQATTPTVIAGGNVTTSITDNGTCNYTIHFDIPMSNLDYGVVVSSAPRTGNNSQWVGGLEVLSKTLTSVTVGSQLIGDLALCTVFVIE